MTVVEVATQILKVEEGFRGDVYLCSGGYPTVGYGIKLGYHMQPLKDYKDFPTISTKLGEVWLSEALQQTINKIEADPNLTFFSSLDPIRAATVASMCYQMGVEGFKRFKNTIKYLEERDYHNASVEMLDSLWAKKQSTNRAIRHSRMIDAGVLLQYYT
jgi:lysozyme